MKHPLYTWQRDCIEQWLANDGMGIVKVVTGAGKSRMALSGAKELELSLTNRLKVYIVVPKTFMVGQWTSFIMETYAEYGVNKEDIGCYYGLHKDTPDRSYMIYVINSARYALARHILIDFKKGHSVLVIADECHHYASAENRKIFDFLPKLSHSDKKNYFSLGLSATPLTEGFDDTLVPSLGPLIYTYGFGQAIESKVINNCVLYNIGLRFTGAESIEYADLSIDIAKLLSVSHKYTLISLKEKKQDFFIILRRLAGSKDLPASRWAIGLLGLLYKRRTLIHEASVRLECAAVLISRLDPLSTIIIFGERISQTDFLYESLDKMYPNKVARYHSEMGGDAKKQALDRFKNKEVRILVSCKALDEGFNIPNADVGIVLSSTSAQRQRIQRLGRVLRSSSTKALSNLYYFFISDTVEEKALLKEPVTQMQEFTLHYFSDEKHFSHDVYDELAHRVVEHMNKKKQDESIIDIMRYFLELGQLKSDWLLEEEAIQERVNQSQEKVEKNYWLCMLQMARMREENAALNRVDN